MEFRRVLFRSDAEKPWIERHLSWFGTGASDHLPSFDVRDHDPLTGAMLLDYQTYLRDNLLVKVDRATMLSSVEARAPYLDRFVTAFALTLPPDLRVRGLTTKWILKKAAEKWVPKDVIYRRKRGLSVPIAGWINGTLRSEVDRLLAPRRLREQALVDVDRITELLKAHRENRANHAKTLWAVIMLQYWLENWA